MMLTLRLIAGRDHDLYEPFKQLQQSEAPFPIKPFQDRLWSY